MSKMDDNHRYHPYYRTKNHHNDRRYDHDYKHQYKKSTKHYNQHSTSRRDNRNYTDLSHRHSHRNDYPYQNQTHSSRSRSYTCFSTSPQPLMSTEIPPLLPSLSPPLPPPPLPLPLFAPPLPSSPTVVPHQRESWIRSVKKTKLNESMEQKTQYLETILRMPQQQKTLLNSSRFDRMRFADKQISTTIPATTNDSDNLDNSSFHFIGDISNHDEICTLEKVLFNNELKSQTTADDKCTTIETLPTPPSSLIECKSISHQDRQALLCSGFLIDDCDEEEVPPVSPPPRSPLPRPSPDEFIEQNDEDVHEQRVMLVHELDAADAEQRQELKRQKRLHRKLQKKKKETKQSITNSSEEQQIISTVPDHQKQESLSDWVIEYDINGNNPMSQLTDEVRRASITMTDQDKTEKVNMILMKIKKQQEELRKLRQYVVSMLGEQPPPQSKKKRQQNSELDHSLLVNFVNQPLPSGCWLCSGKMYAEAAIQCDDVTEQ
ncbi:unnamed protein product [Rotaria socialis]|uniref:Uncharacterized protein n=1 Tax=Rotaria socialis TaxID=392032 RepID=A0A820PI56_9BILA|nr:unnamed protein product [Rotaria socialis]CAF4403441.1 unnamed protein product [Rotaria socialis]